MEIIQFGDRSLLIRWEDSIDPDINRRVHLMNSRLSHEAIICTIPAYSSLTVVFDKEKIEFNNLAEVINNIDLDEDKNKDEGPVLRIPVCYHTDFGYDLEEVAESKFLESQDIINLHTSREYRVYMMGFLPGFVYLGGMAKTLRTDRKQKPRLKVEAGSVGLAGLQTGIYPLDSPGGWQIIGRTPVRTFQHDRTQPFIFQNGDRVKFYSISMEEFSQIKSQDPKREKLYG